MKEKLERIKALVRQGRSETAINELTGILSAHEMLNEAILHSGRLSTLQKQIREGIVDWEDANITHDSIMKSILGLVKVIEEEEVKLSDFREKNISTDESGNKTEVTMRIKGDKNNVIGSVDGDVNITNN